MSKASVKRTFFVAIFLMMLITFVFLPYKVRQHSRLRRELQEGPQGEDTSQKPSMSIRSPFLPFRRKLQSPIHTRKSAVQKTNKVHKMYRDTIGRLLREAKTFRDYFRKSHSIFPWRMRKMDNSKKSQSKHRYLVYRCDTTRRCGDWIRSVKGIVTSYLLASLTDRALKVEMLDSPCPFTQFLVPNIVNWSLPSSFHTQLNPGPSVYLFSSAPRSNFFRSKTSTSPLNVSELFPKTTSYVYVTGNDATSDALTKIRRYVIQRRLLEWMKDLSENEIVSALLKFLFKPSPALARKLKPKEFVGFSVMTSSRHKMACTTLVRRNGQDVSAVLKTFVTSYANKDNYKVFTPSDSTDALNLSVGDDNLFKPPRDLISNLTSSVAVAAAAKGAKPTQAQCGYLDDVFAYLVFTSSCDVILVNNGHNEAPYVRLAAVARGVTTGVVCVSRDGKSLSKKPCV